ncbi:hypothetical protein FS749_010547 [Ceratobasidium sp. UAMH 11750]|nr:hypothetical protein FS749_010547 [Ceratobasidium sp. UAMH 11750]
MLACLSLMGAATLSLARLAAVAEPRPHLNTPAPTRCACLPTLTSDRLPSFFHRPRGYDYAPCPNFALALLACARHQHSHSMAASTSRGPGQP